MIPSNHFAQSVNYLYRLVTRKTKFTAVGYVIASVGLNQRHIRALIEVKAQTVLDNFFAIKFRIQRIASVTVQCQLLRNLNELIPR